VERLEAAMSAWRDTLAAARVKVFSREPYFCEVLMNLRVVEFPGYGTFGVDEGGRLYVDPGKVSEWGADGCAAVLAHEVQHVVRDHAGRRGDREMMLANIAADCEINDDVLEAGWKFPVIAHDKDGKGASPLTPQMFGLPPRGTFEEYYEIIRKKVSKAIEQAMKEGGVPGAGGKCGGCAGNPGPEGSGSMEERARQAGIEVPDPMSAQDKELLRRRTAENVRQHEATSRGTVPAGLRAWAESVLTPPRVDWRKRLRAMVRNAVAARSGPDNTTWARLSRRYWAQRAVLGDRAIPRPSLNSPVPKVVIVLDTSGSMTCAARTAGATRLELALSEVMGVVRALQVPVACCAVDAAVHVVEKVRRKSQVQRLAVGFGGTDMRVGVVEALKHRPDVVVVLTDGETPWPAPHEMPVRTRLVAAVVTDIAVPEHIRHVVRVDTED
jgi:predicted metal-dependent peptidase